MQWWTWVFSGIGVVAIGWIVEIVRRRSSGGRRQSQRAGDNSVNIQAGRDIKDIDLDRRK